MSTRSSTGSLENSEPLKRAFAPVADANTRVLILGSLPGEMSLAAGRYYAHPQNALWRLVGAVLDEDLPAMGYETRLERLLARGVGLWDSIETARRRGSLDSEIRDVEARDLAALAATLPSLRAIAFNGAKSAAIGSNALGERYLAETDLAVLRLPSSSPALAGMTFEQKRAAWIRLQDFLPATG
jgi:TDG/mug DNA glycosylase family protein